MVTISSACVEDVGRRETGMRGMMCQRLSISSPALCTPRCPRARRLSQPAREQRRHRSAGPGCGLSVCASHVPRIPAAPGYRREVGGRDLRGRQRRGVGAGGWRRRCGKQARRRAGWPEQRRGRCGRYLAGGQGRRRRGRARRGQETTGNQEGRRSGMADGARIHTSSLSPPIHRTRGWFLSTHSRVACSSVGRNNVMLCYVMTPGA